MPRRGESFSSNGEKDAYRARNSGGHPRPSNGGERPASKFILTRVVENPDIVCHQKMEFKLFATLSLP